MTSINEIFQAFGSEYLDRFSERMPPHQRKTIHDIASCRSQRAGVVFLQCTDCGALHVAYRSCGNRHCPSCQYPKTMEWLETQVQRQLPGHHFLITFTVPEQIRFFIRSNQRLAYQALFKASSEAMKKLTRDRRHIGADLPGFFGVLHTWGRTLTYHPHVHYLVVGGALSTDDLKWHPSRIDFYLPVRALSKIYRAKFKAEMKKAGRLDEISPQVWKLPWNVNCQAVGESPNTLKYLAPYVFKVAIANSRIVSVENRMVTFRYRKVGSNRRRTMKLEVMEFIRRFLQHVLPAGFMKVRYYGLLNPASKYELETIARLIELSRGFTLPTIAPPELAEWTPHPCPVCGGKLRLLAILLPDGRFIRPG